MTEKITVVCLSSRTPVTDVSVVCFSFSEVDMYILIIGNEDDWVDPSIVLTTGYEQHQFDLEVSDLLATHSPLMVVFP